MRSCLGIVVVAGLAFLSGCNRGAHPIQVGKVAPDFTVSDDTTTVNLASYRGKVVLLNFWWSQCAPCIEETPGLLALHRDMPGLVMLGVSIDDNEEPYRQFLSRYHVDYTTVRDPNETAAKLFHTDGWPETYIIDRRGIIRRKVVGDPDWSNPEIRAYLQSFHP